MNGRTMQTQLEDEKANADYLLIPEICTETSLATQLWIRRFFKKKWLVVGKVN